MSFFQQNNLISSHSPYLRQHAEQPVYWQSWNSDTVNFARQQNKPILLSIGYSACHWCHRMARESFSNPQIAEFINHHFVAIKLDREERPDLDKLYQQTHQALNQAPGGWPLNVFLEPNSLMPFFAGTYFPDEKSPDEKATEKNVSKTDFSKTDTSKISGSQQTSFQQVLVSIQDIFQNKADDVQQMTNQVKQYLLKLNQTQQSHCEAELVNRFLQQYLKYCDKQWGGLQGAPKFPQATILTLLLNSVIHKRPAESEQLYQAIMLASQSMSKVGLFDHLAGGFFRYCVDDYWGVPHFEKMLYDNALLMSFYAQLARFNKEGSVAYVCRRVHQWLNGEMKHDSGGYCATLDADTKEQEGAYYLFDKQEVKSLLTEQEWHIAEVAFGLHQAPNLNNQWHLHQWYSDESLAKKLDLPLKQIQWQIEPIKQKLLAHRSQRSKPLRDEKILTAWNALTVTAMYQAGQLLNDEAMIEQASTTLDFIHNNLWLNQSLMSCYKDGFAYQSGFLDDYAYLADAILESLKSQWSSERFDWLEQLIEKMVDEFYDTERNAFRFSNENDCPVDMVSFADDALPNGNAIAVKVLQAFGQLTENTDYSHMANSILQSAADAMHQTPLGHASMLSALLMRDHRQHIVIRGHHTDAIQWQQRAHEHPGMHAVYFIPNDASLPDAMVQKYPEKPNCYAIMSSDGKSNIIIDDLEQLLPKLKQH